MPAAQYENDVTQTDPVADSICPSTASPFPWSLIAGQDKYEATCGGRDYELEVSRVTFASVIEDVT